MKSIKFWKIELVAAIGLFSFIIYRFLKVGNHIIRLGKASGMDKPFTDKGIPFDYASDYAYYYLYPDIARLTTAFLAFLFLNFYVLPLFDRRKYGLTIFYTLLSAALLWIVFTFSAMREQAYVGKGFWYFVDNGASFVPLFFLFILYVIIKKIVGYYLKKQETLIHKLVQELLIALAVWLVVLTALNSFEIGIFADYWTILFPFAYLLFTLHLYWMLPEFENKGRKLGPYLLKLIIFFLLFILFCFLFFPNTYLLRLLILLVYLSVIVIPLAWIIYQRNKSRINELLLKQELGKAAANLQFLKSQINPHFLFNALNTLYGTAIQENANRTGEGIQKLGDMMRFMLHENHQDRILITKEIDYLRNYIDLQQLRIQNSPDITIEINIENPVNEQYTAPMLLIPFVENAFKHGISLAQKSWVKITLRTDPEKLYFDVHNSIHSRKETDPEKHASGIGLENVKQRLNLLYPDKHELIIRETEEEFFIHLTIQLS